MKTFLPTWSLNILEITTGTLCSAPPWKAEEKKMTKKCVDFSLGSQNHLHLHFILCLHLFFFFFFFKCMCLLWCSSPDRRSPVFAVQQFCALEDGSFLLAKRYYGHWNRILGLARREFQWESAEPSGALTFTWVSVPLVQTTSSFCMVNTSLANFRQTS